MTTLIIFLILSLAEFILIYFKIEQMKQTGAIGQAIGQATGLKEKYQPFLDKVAHWFLGLKWLLWIFVPLILMINLMAAWILSLVFDFIVFIISNI